MKVIISGSTGLVGRELIRQSLLNPRVTSVIALTRRHIDVAAIAASISSAEREGLKELNTSKVKSVLLQDFTKYPDDVKKELADADACVWSLAHTPVQHRQHPWDEVVLVNKGYCTAGMEAIAEARQAAGQTGEFRFVYVSGHGISRDITKKPYIWGDYILLRAEIENIALDFAKEQQESGWKACIAKPGLISGHPGVLGVFKNAGISAFGLVGHTISVKNCAKAMLKQCVDGIEKETLENWDLAKIAKGEKL